MPLSNGAEPIQYQIAAELGLSESDAHRMASQLREGVYEQRPEVVLCGEVEADELYVIAGYKGHPEAVKKSGASPGAGN